MKNELTKVQQHTKEHWHIISARIVECVNALEGCTSEEIALISEYVKKRDNNLMFDYALKGKHAKTLHHKFSLNLTRNFWKSTRLKCLKRLKLNT